MKATSAALTENSERLIISAGVHLKGTQEPYRGLMLTATVQGRSATGGGLRPPLKWQLAGNENVFEFVFKAYRKYANIWNAIFYDVNCKSLTWK